VMIDGQVRHMEWLKRADGSRVVVVARNNDRLQVMRPAYQGAAAPRGRPR